MYVNMLNQYLVRSRNILSTATLRNVTMLSSNQSHNEVAVELLKGDDAGIVVFGLNKSSTRNALGSSMTSSLFDAIDKLSSYQNARVLILRSLVPGIFCAGADLKERLKLSNSEVASTVERLSLLATTIEKVKIPTIAAIDGVAFGGGLEICLGCDIRTVSEDAKLGLVETKWAILPAAGGSQRLPRIINPSLAKELIFCAKVIDGQQALKIGLANHAVKQNLSSDAAYLKALEIARQILLNGPLGVNMAKVAINKGLETDLTTGCKIEQLCYAQVIPSQDRIEGLLAFNEKRNPKYIAVAPLTYKNLCLLASTRTVLVEATNGPVYWCSDREIHWRPLVAAVNGRHYCPRVQGPYILTEGAVSTCIWRLRP